MNAIVRFFKTIFLVDLLKGLWVTLKYTPQPAFTFQYPAERRPTAPRFRGVLRLQTEPGTGAQTCIVCDQCAKACPDDLIALGGHREPGTKIKVLDYFDFIVHIFAPETRVFYGLERLWGSAERVEVPAP